MQNFTGMPSYSGYQFNPMLPVQQRLAQMETQYPQFTQQPTQQPAQQPSGQGARALLVLNRNEAEAQQVPTDGTITVFINNADNELYIKRLGNMGLLEFKTYTLKDEPKQEKIQIKEENNDIETIKKDIVNIREEIEAIKNVKQSNADVSNNRTVKKQS